MKDNDACLLDLGNTRYKWMMQSELPDGEPDGEVYAEGESAAGKMVRDLLAQSAFDRMLVSSVRDSRFNKAFADVCRSVAVVAPEFITIPDPPLIPLAYQDVSRFGVDRYLTLIGAMHRYHPPFIVVDAGTAVTFDAVDKSGRHIGGCIHPGLGLLRASLIRGTAGIFIQQQGRSSLFADSTEAGINGGTEQGFISAIDGILGAMQSEINDKASILLTGGDADQLLPFLSPSVSMDSTLLFEGINRLTSPHFSPVRPGTPSR